MESRRFVCAFAVLAFLSAMLLAQAPAQAPRIWDDAALADWATPIAALNVRPAHTLRPSTTTCPATTCAPIRSITPTSSRQITGKNSRGRSPSLW
jgi:hypothetical protein